MLRKFLLIKLFVLFVIGFAGSEVEDFLKDLEKNISFTDSNTIEAQKRKYYIGGGASYRAPSATLHPFTVVPPHVRAGCGGIDITFGSFSYLKPRYFVDFAKKTVAQAPGFAFDIALEIMCPQCSSIMKRLTALANQINAMSLNSCQLLANLSNRIKSKVLNHSVATGGSDSWLTAVDDKLKSWGDLLSSFNDYLSNLGCNDPDCFLFAGHNSIAERFVKELQDVNGYTYWNTDNMKMLVRTVFGDFVKVTQNNQNNPSTYRCIKPHDGMVEELMGLAENEYMTYIKVFTSGGNAIEVPFITVRKYVREKLDSVVDKIINKQALTSDELEFLARYDIPALGILRIFAPSPSALYAIKDKLEEYLAYELAHQFVAVLYSRYAEFVTKVKNLEWYSPDMKEEDVKCMRELMEMKSAREILTRFMDEVHRRKAQLIEQLRLALDLYELERVVYSKFSNHPLMASYVFGSLMK